MKGKGKGKGNERKGKERENVHKLNTPWGFPRRVFTVCNCM